MFKKTKEKINNNEYVILFKKLWANKRYRSILILVLYFIFFTVVITATRSNYQNMENNNVQNNQPEISIVDKINTWNSFSNDYQYIVLVNEQEVGQILVIDGITNLIVNNKTYTIINNNIYLNKNDDLKKVNKIDDLEISIPVLKLNIKDIMNYAKDIKDYTYEDNTVKYQIPRSYFIDSEEEMNETLLVEVTGNDILEKVIIHNDLENITLEIKES